MPQKSNSFNRRLGFFFFFSGLLSPPITRVRSASNLYCRTVRRGDMSWCDEEACPGATRKHVLVRRGSMVPPNKRLRASIRESLQRLLLGQPSTRACMRIRPSRIQTSGGPMAGSKMQPSHFRNISWVSRVGWHLTPHATVLGSFSYSVRRFERTRGAFTMRRMQDSLRIAVICRR